MLIRNETINREPDDDTFSLYLRLGVLCVVGCIALLGVAALYAAKHMIERPSFVEPKIVANGPYEPRPYYPEQRVVPEQLIELSKMERVNRITE